jgi:hypothetical protein
LTLAAERWTLTHRSVGAVELALALGLGLGLWLGLPVLVAASSVADAEAEVAEGVADVAEGDGEYGARGVCWRVFDGEGDAVGPLPGLVCVAEGLGEGVGEGDGDSEGDEEGDGEGEAVTGSAWHCLSVAVAAVGVDAASAPSCRLVNTPRVRNPPVSKLIVAALTYPKRMRIALSALLVRVTVCSS